MQLQRETKLQCFVFLLNINVGNLPKAADELGETQMKIHTTENRRVLH